MLLSRRFIPQLAALAVLALLPVLLHSYLGHRRDECADPFRLVPSSNVGAKAERDAYMKAHLSAFQWREGKVKGGDGAPTLDYSIVRSYEAKKLYYLIERRLLKVEPDEEKRVSASVDGVTLPIRTLRFDPKPGSRTGRLAAYLLVYDGEPVDDPYRIQLLSAPSNLVLGALPMTAFFVIATLEVDEAERVRARQIEWLEQSWRNYRSICFP